MSEEWLNRIFVKNQSKKITPDDSSRYLIGNDIIDFTSGILCEYGNLTPPNEGFVFWAGQIIDGETIISSAFAPDTISFPGGVKITTKSTVDFVLFLSNHKLTHIANVHSHPGSWVGHSAGDDLMVPFKKPKLLSIVVPRYGMKEKFNLLNCGIHRFDNQTFLQLSSKYVRKKFDIVQFESLLLFDSRDKESLKWKRKIGTQGEMTE